MPRRAAPEFQHPDVALESEANTRTQSRAMSHRRPCGFGSKDGTQQRSRDPSPKHHALSRVAVVTGAASGIGHTAALALACLCLKIAIANLPACANTLNALGVELTKLVGETNMLVVPTDVTDLAPVQRLRDTVYDCSEVGVLLNNAGISGTSRDTSWDNLPSWHVHPIVRRTPPSPAR
ncbi:hypothetical protein B0H10DRAFT_2235433 [Mycena sp. CBHHK59/15]|nr:hypothetical protein B0H10DRAFT_2235433 [Mycena sp. CBHHK59/15]